MQLRLGVFFCLISIFTYANDKALEVEVYRHIPTDVLLEMIASSQQLSALQKVGIKFWILQRGDQVKRVMGHIDMPENFTELKSDIHRGMHQENVSFDTKEGINDILKAIDRDKDLMKYVDNQLKNGSDYFVYDKKEIFKRCLDKDQEHECDDAKQIYKEKLMQHVSDKHRGFLDKVIHNFNTTV